MPNTRLAVLPAALPAALLAAASAAAQQAPDTARARRLDSVVVQGARAPRPSAVTVDVRGLPAPVTVLGHQELDRTNYTRDAGALLRRVPGIMSHNLGQGGTGTSVKMRGFLSSTHGADAAAYIDGMPQNLPSSAIAHGMNDMSWLTPAMIERIEVVRGPFSALYGDQNRSGAINIVTRAAGPPSVAVQGGSYGYARGTGVASAARGRFAGLAVGDAYTVDGYRANAGQHQRTLFVKPTVTVGPSAFALRGVYHSSRWSAPGFLNLAALQGGLVTPAARDTTTPPLWGDAERASLVFTRTPAEGGEQGVFATAFAEGYKRTRTVGVNLTDLNVLHDRRRIAGGRLLGQRAWGDAGALAVGAEARTDRGDAINRRWSRGLPGANYTFDQDLDLLTYGAFAQGQLRPLPRVKLVGGLRADAFDYDIANRKLRAASARYRRSVVTPRGGLVLSPLTGRRLAVDVYGNLGQGFRSPGQAELSPSGALGPLGASGGTGYPNLGVPKLRSTDYGASALVAGRVRVAGAAYRTVVDNEITQVSPGVFDAVGRVTRAGWEADASAPLTRALDAYASYGRITRASIDNPVPNTATALGVPRHTAKGGAAYTRGAGVLGALLLNFDASYLSGLPYFSGTPLARRTTRPYTRYDLRATLRRGPLDYTAFATAQPTEFGSEVATSSTAGALVEPRPARDLGVSVRYRFGVR